MKKIVAILLSLMFVFALASCGGGTNTNTNTTTNSNTTNTNQESNKNTDTEVVTPGNTDGGNVGGGDETGENPAPIRPDYDSTTVEEALKEDLKVFDKADTYGDEGEILDFTTSYDINVSKVALNSTYKITKAGTYRVYGTSTDGQIYVNAVDQHVVLVLDGVSLTSGNSVAGPAIYAVDCASVTIVLKEGTQNYLADNSKNDGEGAVIRVRSCNLTLTGKGSLQIDANAKNAVANTKELTIDGGNYVLNAPGHGIYGKLGVTINGGKFDINAGKSGIKSGDGNSALDYEYGYIDVNSGSIDIDCVTNGFNCVGPVTIADGRVVVDSESGNAIEAVENVEINGGTVIMKSYKSAISSDADVKITAKSNVRLETTGNGISATNVTISTNGILFIKTVLAFETVTDSTSDTETRYVLVDDEYVVYDPTIHSSKLTQYVQRPGKGINATKVTVTKGTLGIDACQDCINTNAFETTGGKFVLYTLKDAIDADSSTISNNADIKILGSDKGINSKELSVSGGKLYVIAAKDAINTNSAVISGGVVYLFDKIDKGTSGTVTVNGGVLLMVTTNKNAQATEGSAKYISAPIVNKEYALAGNWINVISGDDDAVKVELPKDYIDGMVVYYSSATMGDDVMVAFGTIDENNKFSVIITETIE